MPYIQKGANNYFGFMPVEGGTIPSKVNPYLVSSSNSQINRGDVVIITSSGVAGTVASLTFGAAVSSTWVMLGVAAQSMAANTGSTAAWINTSSTQMLLVYDDPQQLFVTCDTTSFLISSTAGIGKNVGFLTTGPVGFAPNATLLQSVQALAGNSASSGLYMFKIVAMHPVESGYSTDQGGTGVAASVRKWIVQPNVHYYGQGTGGLTAVTT